MRKTKSHFYKNGHHQSGCVVISIIIVGCTIVIIFAYYLYNVPSLDITRSDQARVNMARAQSQLRETAFGSIKHGMRENCFENLPLLVGYNGHHKTGSRFSQNLQKRIFKYCNIPLKYHYKLSHTTIGNNQQHWTKHLWYEPNWEIEYFGKTTHWPRQIPNYQFFADAFGLNYILLHFIRSPLNIIISAFNYHKGCFQERWLDCKFANQYACQLVPLRWKPPKKYVTIKHLIRNRTVDVNYNNHVADSAVSRLTKLETELTKNLMQMMNDRYSKHKYSQLLLDDDDNHYGNLYNCYRRGNMIDENQLYDLFVGEKNSVCKICKNDRIDLQLRLYLEFIRFVNCEFDELYATFLMIKNYTYGYNFRMEYYTNSSEDFDTFTKTIMIDILNLKYENEMINFMSKNDVNRWSNKKMGQNKHVVGSNPVVKVDTKTQIHLLLSFQHVHKDGNVVHVCHIIKDMTLKLHYKWPSEFDAYC